MQCGICKGGGKLSKKEKSGEYTLWECSECAGQFWTPMKGPGPGWYEEDCRYSFRNRDPLRQPENEHKEFLKLGLTPGGRLLDIGMGTGNFLNAAVKRGYDGCGVDFDRDAIDTAREVFGLKNVFVMDVDGALEKFGESSFDIVSFFQVLEHIENPGEFIKKVKRLLKKGGHVVLAVPYRGFWDKLKMGDRPPRHLTRWDEKSIFYFFKMHDFEMVQIKKLPVPIRYVIQKFHFWFMGIFSFDTVNKMRAQEGGGKKVTEDSWKIKLVKVLAKVKDFVLFVIPATLLYICLFVTGKRYLNLFVVAKKK